MRQHEAPVASVAGRQNDRRSGSVFVVDADAATRPSRFDGMNRACRAIAWREYGIVVDSDMCVVDETKIQTLRRQGNAS